MKKAGSLLLLTALMLLCGIGLRCPSASASGPYFTDIPVRDVRNGVLTLESGEKWYRVKGFENNADYMIAVRTATGEQRLLAVTWDDESRYIWNYYVSNMTTSTAPRISTLSNSSYTLCRTDGGLGMYYSDDTGDRTWAHEDAKLCYRTESELLYLKYDAEDEPSFSLTAVKAEAAEVLLYARQDTVSRCIVRQPAAESYVTEGSGYPAPVFSVGLSDVTVDRVQWFADDEDQHCDALNFSADCLKDRPAGVHRIRCQVTAHDSDGVHYCEDSAEASFVIAKGVVPDSVMTFSDIHEEYGFISDAIEQIMEKTGGYIPSLVICSGDFVYGPTAEKDRELSWYFPQIVSQLGGLDAVYVAGNHDSAEAASVMSAAAGLGAAHDLPAKGGVIFRGESEAVAQNGTNSRFAKGILTYGINFDAALRRTDRGLYYTYEDVIGDVDRFLSEAAEQYHGELIVISAHSGLHVVGVQFETPYDYQPMYGYWAGENAYNIDQSFALAQTINRYAEQYDMDILYLFGHDHSRGELEFFLTDGDTLISPVRYEDRLHDTMTLSFTYANAGYLSTVIGSASRKFSFIYRDGDKFSYDLISAANGSSRHREFTAKHPYEEPAVTETTAAETAGVPETTETVTETQTASDGQNIPAPKTGDDFSAVLITCAAAFILALHSRLLRGAGSARL